MAQTSNLGLTLPELEGKITADIPAMAENFETIDAAIANVEAMVNNTLQNEISELNSGMEEYKATASEQISDLNSELDAYKSATDEQLETLNTSVETHSAQISELNTNIEAHKTTVNSQIGELNATTEAHTSQITELRTDLNECNNTVSALQTSTAELSESMEAHKTSTNAQMTKYQETVNAQMAAFAQEIVFGTYTGNGEAEQTINLGFEPIAVEVYTSWGAQSSGYSGKSDSFMFGGLAIKGYPCGGNNLIRIRINTNGFTVYTQDDGSQSYNDVHTNDANTTYYFKAFKNSEIKVVS